MGRISGEGGAPAGCIKDPQVRGQCQSSFSGPTYLLSTMAGSTCVPVSSLLMDQHRKNTSVMQLTSKKPTSSSSSPLGKSEQPSGRKSSIFTIENLLAPSTKSRTSPASTSPSAPFTPPSASQQLHQQQPEIHPPSFFSVLRHPGMPALHLADPATFGYGYLGNTRNDL